MQRCQALEGKGACWGRLISNSSITYYESGFDRFVNNTMSYCLCLFDVACSGLSSTGNVFAQEVNTSILTAPRGYGIYMAVSEASSEIPRIIPKESICY